MDPPATGTPYLDLTVLAEYPWLCKIPARRDIDATSGSRYGSFLETVNERIIFSEHRALSDAPPGPVPLLRALGLGDATIPGHGLLQSLLAHKSNPQQSSSTGSTFHSKISLLASVLLQYKLFDVVTAASSPGLINPSGQPYKYAIPDPGKIYFKRMANWPQVIQQGLKALRETSSSEDAQSQYPHDPRSVQFQPSQSQANATYHLLNSLSRRMQEADGHSILSNFETAALYMAVLYQMKDPGAEIPGTANELRSFLSELFLVEDGSWDVFLEKLEKPQSFKLPLHFALAVSPVCLFLPTQLMRRDVSRLNLLLMWQGLGGSRPPSLLHVELKIYQALIDVALGVCMPRQRFDQLFEELAAVNYQGIPFSETEWLASHEESPFKIRAGHGGNSQGHVFRLASTTSQGHPNAPVIEPTMNASIEPIRADDSILDVSTDSGSRRRGTIKRSSQEAFPQKPTRRTRKGLAVAVVHDVVDLTTEREIIAVKTAGPSVQPIERHELEVCFGGPERSSCCFTAVFYSRPEKERFQLLWDLGQQFLANRSTSIRRCVQFVDNNDFKTWSNSLGQATLREKMNVVIYGLPGLPRNSELDQDTLRTVASSFRRVVSAYDFSLPPPDREKHVLLETFLEAVNPPAKIIRSGQFPITVPVLVPSIITSDVIAWDATYNQPWCRRHERPLNALHFGCVATASSYEDFRVPSQGFGVYFKVLVGALWLFLGDRGEEESILPLGHSLHGGHIHYEPVWLQAGSAIAIRPGVAFYSIAVAHSIFSGSYWYGSSTLTATAISIVREFLGGNPSPPASLTDMNSARQTLRRLVHFYHMVYTTGLFHSRRTSDECAHTPDPSTPEGLESLLSLCNLMELGNILAGDDYTYGGTISESERRDIIEARRLCRRIVDWVHRHFIILDQHTNQAQSLHDQVWMPYLARYIKAILESKSVEAKGRPPQSHDAQATISILNASFGSSEVLQRHMTALDSTLENSTSLNLLFPGFRTILIQPRDKPLPEDPGHAVVGETVTDANYYRILSGLAVS